MMSTIARRLEHEARTLGATRVSFEWKHKHPWIVVELGTITVIQSFSSTSTGNGRALKNLVANLRRKMNRACNIDAAPATPHHELTPTPVNTASDHCN